MVALALISALVALEPPGDILQITIFSGSLYAACFFPAVVLGLYWSKGHALAVMASMVTGTITLVSWLGLNLSATVHEVFPALAVSTLTYVLFSRRGSASVQLPICNGLVGEYLKILADIDV